MAQPKDSDRELSPEELKATAQEMNVTSPIMAYRVVGSIVELYLLGGHSVTGSITNEDLKNLSMKDLYSLAQGLIISGRSKMSREELEEAILSYSN